MKTKLKSLPKKRRATAIEPARKYNAVADLPNVLTNGIVMQIKQGKKTKLTDMSDKTFVTKLKESMRSDAAFEYAAKMQGQFEEHKQVLRCAMVMKQTISDRGFWSIIDNAWEFSAKRTLNDAKDRTAVMQINRCKINLQINWTNDTVVTTKQVPSLRAATDGGFKVWSCLRHDKNGATAIMLRNLDENTFMIVYEDGTYTKSFGVYRLKGDEWPTVAKMSRDTAKDRKLAERAARKLEVIDGGGLSISRYAKK